MNMNCDSPTRAEETGLPQAGKYLTFILNRERFAVEIEFVNEIISTLQITPIPYTPGYVKGVINLRGKVIPIIDLRLCLGLVGTDETLETCVIVVEAADVVLGFYVDQVAEVMHIDTNQIVEPPRIVTRGRDGYIRGIGKVRDHVILMLGVENILARDVHVASVGGF